MNTLSNHERALDHLANRENLCRVEQRVYGKWLGVLTPVRWITVGGGILLSTLAGATVFGRPEILGTKWALWSGVFAFGSAALTSLHTALGCDAHQAECRRLIQVYESLEAGYRAARFLPEAELQAERASLDRQFQETKLKAAASPPYWFGRRERDAAAG